MSKNKFLKTLIAPLLLFGAFSCQKTEVISDLPGRLSSYYLIKSYLETDNISIKKSIDYIHNDDSYAIHFNGQKTIEENSAEFKPLALQHGEKGVEKFYFWAPYFLHIKVPLNISKIKFFDKNGSDISDKVLVMMSDIKGVILSNYEKVVHPDQIRKPVSELDKDNLSYIPNPLFFKIDDTRAQDGIVVEVTLGNGKVLKAEYKEK